MMEAVDRDLFESHVKHEVQIDYLTKALKDLTQKMDDFSTVVSDLKGIIQSAELNTVRSLHDRVTAIEIKQRMRDSLLGPILYLLLGVAIAEFGHKFFEGFLK